MHSRDVAAVKESRAPLQNKEGVLQRGNSCPVELLLQQLLKVAKKGGVRKSQSHRAGLAHFLEGAGPRAGGGLWGRGEEEEQARAGRLAPEDEGAG